MPPRAVKIDDLLLDAALHDQPGDGHGAGLADAVGAIGGLIFDCGIPRVQVNDIVGCGEVQALPTRPQANEEQAALACLEGIDLLLALLGRGAAVQ